MSQLESTTTKKELNASRRIPTNGVDYPLHFFNQLYFDPPTNKKEMFKWAQILSTSQGILERVIDIYSRYPITKVIVTAKDEAQTNFWTDLLNNTLSIQKTLITNGKDYYTYGNCIVSIIPPFDRYLKCGKCGAYRLHNISCNEDVIEWKFADFKFTGVCKSCGHKGVMEPIDEFNTGMDASKKVVIKRWPPINIDIEEMLLAGRKKIYYTLEKKYVTGIKNGNRFTVASVPMDFINAVKKASNNFKTRAPQVELVQDCTYHYKYETTTEPDDDGLARPFFMSAWKDVFMTFVLRKAQECIVAEHMVPRQVVFPTSSGNGDIISTVNGEEWREAVDKIIRRMQNDPNEIGVLPGPLGYQQIGGNGKVVSLTDVIDYQDRRIITMLGMPPELIYNGMQYSGMNVALRMLENFCLNYITSQETFLQFLVNALANRLRMEPPIRVKLAKFKMADDVALSNVLSMLGAQQRISPTMALSGVGDGIDLEAEAEQAMKDAPHVKAILSAYQTTQAVATTEANRDADVITNQNQGASFMQQQDIQTTMNSAPERIMIYNNPDWQRNELARMSSQKRAEHLKQVQSQSSQAAWDDYQQKMTSNVDPQPEQKPPRRKP